MPSAVLVDAMKRANSRLFAFAQRLLTTPRSQTIKSHMPVHTIAKAGFGAGTNELYDRARPSYPSEALSAIHSALRTQSPFNVVELGAGTGIFTRALLAHDAFSQSINSLTAVEPSEGMRTVFTKQIVDSRVRIRPGTFEDTGLGDSSADFIVVAQAWHWCPNYDAGMKEIARILKPNGVAFFIWNMEDREAAKWVRYLRELYEVHEANTPQFRLGLWKATFDSESYKEFFEPQEQTTWERAIATTEDGVVDRVFSKSYIAVLTDTDKDGLKTKIHQLLQDNPRTWIDQENGIFEYPYKTFLITMRKKEI